MTCRADLSNGLLCLHIGRGKFINSYCQMAYQTFQRDKWKWLIIRLGNLAIISNEAINRNITRVLIVSTVCLKAKDMSWRVEPRLSECFEWNNDEIIKEVFKVMSTTYQVYKTVINISQPYDFNANSCRSIESTHATWLILKLKGANLTCLVFWFLSQLNYHFMGSVLAGRLHTINHFPW